MAMNCSSLHMFMLAWYGRIKSVAQTTKPHTWPALCCGGSTGARNSRQVMLFALRCGQCNCVWGCAVTWAMSWHVFKKNVRLDFFFFFNSDWFTSCCGIRLLGAAEGESCWGFLVGGFFGFWFLFFGFFGSIAAEDPFCKTAVWASSDNINFSSMQLKCNF